MTWLARALLVAGGAAAVRVALPVAVAATRRTSRPAGERGSVGGDEDQSTPTLPRPPEQRWTRSNFRGARVSLVGGPALAAAASLAAAAGAPHPGAAAAVLAAGLGAGSVGLYDDLVDTRPEHRAKGFHGHLAALRQGRITSGAVKIAGVGAAGLVAAALLERDHYAASGRSGRSGRVGRRDWVGRRGRVGSVVNVLVGAGVVAGAANLLNLLDLRPGRALKVGLLVGAPLTAGPAGGLAAGPTGAVLGALPEDLTEQTMLGDCGANALGALLGTALVARTGLAGRAAVLAGIAALTATSERVSFTTVIANNPVLRRLDELGRHRPPAGGAERSPRSSGRNSGEHRPPAGGAERSPRSSGRNSGEHGG